jgi:hypothetical protein
MRAIYWLAVATTGGLALMAPMTPAAAQNAPAAETYRNPDNATPSRIRPRPPARIRVYPLNQTLGPDAVRQCESWLATEYRPSGTVIVPRMRCWWERG